MRPGDTVPPSRELAHQLGVSRTVVTRAYELLRANGVLTSRRGSGTRVSGHLPAEIRGAAPPPRAPSGRSRRCPPTREVRCGGHGSRHRCTGRTRRTTSGTAPRR
nr:winged helix-turn-helix domain-containing protein [Micromonospora tarapacensis]